MCTTNTGRCEKKNTKGLEHLLFSYSAWKKFKPLNFLNIQVNVSQQGISLRSPLIKGSMKTSFDRFVKKYSQNQDKIHSGGEGQEVKVGSNTGRKLLTADTSRGRGNFYEICLDAWMLGWLGSVHTEMTVTYCS